MALSTSNIGVNIPAAARVAAAFRFLCRTQTLRFRHNASYAIVFGENEYNNKEIIVKNMIEGTQSTYNLNKIDSIIF